MSTTAAPAPIASPVITAPRITERIRSSDMGPSWAATNKPRLKPMANEVCIAAVSQTAFARVPSTPVALPYAMTCGGSSAETPSASLTSAPGGGAIGPSSSGSSGAGHPALQPDPQLVRRLVQAGSSIRFQASLGSSSGRTAARAREVLRPPVAQPQILAGAVIRVRQHRAAGAARTGARTSSAGCGSPAAARTRRGRSPSANIASRISSVSPRDHRHQRPALQPVRLGMPTRSQIVG